MTSSAGSGSGSIGDRSPAAARAMMMENLHNLRERAVMLQTVIEGYPTPPWAATRELTEGMMTSVTSALSALTTDGGGGDGRASSPGARGSGGRRKKGAAVAGPIRRSSSSSFRRRTLSPFLESVTTTKLEDGHAWRKYGQKNIQGSENSRNYYRCTHMPDQGCKARKHVQVSDTNPLEYTINYFGHHTCRDPSTVPFVIEAAAAPPKGASFICFGSSTTTTSAVIPPHRQQAAVDPMTTTLSRFAGSYISTSLPAAAPAHQQDRCGSEEAISYYSGAGLLDDVVVGSSNGRTTTVGSAPEYYWPSSSGVFGGGIDTGSFPSSPTSSLGGFMTGSSFNGSSFGNGIDDDSFPFGFDP
ncbi:hypothetical protein PR202_ga28782 [Eleusine coracana subsp. coracana]|uniref:WRKY domain-containing protein n=1 Tax=Eleusine coracana subsp. coracana TaxID=191504 RepID=A0AAV5DJG5_ELECO|nr:hypothetical protein QOZ80_7AG0581870 [Eleusine coracana subsp. coracana]GJN10667.1 hypothetical protein PR202_ga28782 [Eleusine coracana subsp. coracana]